MLDRKKARLALILILALNFCLTIYGIWWGLPDRWNTDEHIAKALKFIASGSVFTVVDTAHPQAYDILLGLWMAPYLAVLKLIGYPMSSVQAAASVSWIELAWRHPDFASGAYIWGRLSSVFLNLASIIFIYKTAFLICKARRASLVAALTAALSMAFIETGHFAKCASLIVMLLTAVAYYTFKALQGGFERNFYIASALAGAAASSQADGAFSVIYLAAAGVIYLKKEGLSIKAFKIFIVSAAIFLSAFFVLWPALFVNSHLYGAKEIAGFSMTGLPGPGLVLSKLASNAIFTFYLFSPGLALFVWCGAIYSVWKRREYSPYTQIFAWVLGPYLFLAIFYFGRFPGAYTKFLMHSVPISL